MSSKAEYSPEEWAEVVAGPYFASMYIIVADLNVAYFKEVAAMLKAAIDSAAKTTNDLIKAVAVDLTAKDSQDQTKQQFEGLKGQNDPEALKQAIVERVSKATDIVTAKSTEDGEEYRKWLLALGQATAEGSKEGGFLGIGAVRVSDREHQALDELAEVLKASSPF